jgi:hypothetical protein
MRFMLMALMQSQILRRLELAANTAVILGLTQEVVDDECSPEKAEKIVNAFLKIMGKRAAHQEAWKRFCEKIGLPRELGTPVYDESDYVRLMQLTEAIWEEQGGGGPVDEAVVENELTGLMDYWRGLIGT